MIDTSAIAEIIATYQKYGWILRRILLTKETSKKIRKDINTLFGDVTVMDSAIDAGWFSRLPKGGSVAWELRYFGDIPFALLESVDENDAEFENIISSIEQRLRETISAKTSA